jgi:hypothetical protein
MAEINEPSFTSIDFGNFVENPLNILYFFVFYSPLFLSLFIFSSGFVYQNVKGIIYLFFLILVVAIRGFYLKYSKKSEEYTLWEAQLSPACNTGKFTKYGNPGFNLFILAYTFMYVCLPMMINSDINYLVFSVLILLVGSDIGIRYLRFKCIKDVKQIISNLSVGVLIGTIVVLTMYSIGLSQYLFFNELSSNTELCKVQSKQKFKCTVSNNGQVVGTVLR